MPKKFTKSFSKPGRPAGGGGSRDGKSFGGKKFGGKPAGRSFGKKFDDDRPARGRRDDRDGGFKPKRDFGDRPPRRRDDDGFAAKPRGAKSFGDRPRRFDDEKPRRFDGDRPRKFDGDKPRRFDGDKPRRFDGDKPRRFDSDRPRRDDDRPRKFDGEKRPFRSRDGEDKPRGRSFDRADAPRGGGRGFDRDEKPRNSYKPTREAKSFQRPDDARRKPAAKSAWQTEERETSFTAATDDTKRKLKSDRPSLGGPSPYFLYGHHAVRAAILNPLRDIRRILATETGLDDIREALEEAQGEGLKRPQPVIVEKEDLDRLLPREAVHQGVMVDAQQPEDVFLADILIAADDNTKILVLDQVTDPHNVGAILRSAAVFGAAAVVVQKLHAPEITGVLAKSASGAAEMVPLVRETNLSRALEQLKDAGFTCIGLDERGKTTVAGLKPSGRVALVLGAEGDGLRRLVAENCDVLAQLPTPGAMSSLNVSNAAAVALYELVRK